MSGAFYTGLVSGLILAVITGPAFFSLINIASTKGKEAGLMFVAGNFTSYLIFLVLSLLLYDFIDYEFQLQRIIFILIFILLIIVCFLLIFNLDRKIIPKKILYLKSTNALTIFGKGIILNIINPVTIILWSGIFVFYFIYVNGTKDNFIFYFITAIITVLFFDLIKLLSANIISNLINPLYFLFLNKIIATLIIVFIALQFL